jgi:hypothetical protein
MINLSVETPMSFQQAAVHAHCSFQSVWRWALKGCPDGKGGHLRLRAMRVGCKWITSREALQEFSEALTPTFDDGNQAPERTPSKREKANRQAAAECAAAGL